MNQTSMTSAPDTTAKRLFTYEEATLNSIADSINRRDDCDALMAIERLRKHLVDNPLHARVELPPAISLNATQPAPEVEEPANDRLSKIAERASDLSNRCFMQWQEAEEMALSEFGVSLAQIQEVVEDFPDYSPEKAMLMSHDDMMRFAIHMLVFSPLNAKPNEEESPPECPVCRDKVFHILAYRIYTNAKETLANLDNRDIVCKLLGFIRDDALEQMGYRGEADQAASTDLPGTPVKVDEAVNTGQSQAEFLFNPLLDFEGSPTRLGGRLFNENCNHPLREAAARAGSTLPEMAKVYIGFFTALVASMFAEFGQATALYLAANVLNMMKDPLDLSEMKKH